MIVCLQCFVSMYFFFFSSRRRHTRFDCDWSSDVCSSDLKLGRSLERFARLRRLAPRDDDITVAHARVLAWADRTAAAGALYDSVLARAPDRTDALAGRARTVAWSGDLDRAQGLWGEALGPHPGDPEG